MKISIKNRSSSSVGYSIPELNIKRYLAAGETTKVEREEIEKLAFQNGGKVLLRDYLLIDDKELAQEFCELALEPEYWMTEEEVKSVILYGSLDKFLDTLDYAPQGVLDMIKSLSISLPMKDTDKMAAFQEKTGFNVAQALRNQKLAEDAAKADGIVAEEKPKRGRRVAIDEAVTPNYKVVNRK